MMEWMEHLTQEDVRRIRLVAEALGWHYERVVKTPYTTLILELACKLIELRTEHGYNEQLLKSIESFLEENRK